MEKPKIKQVHLVAARASLADTIGGGGVVVVVVVSGGVTGPAPVAP